MRITSRQLRQIIREELAKELTSITETQDRTQQDADIASIQRMLTQAFDPDAILPGTDEESLLDAVSMIDTRYKFEKLDVWCVKTFGRSLTEQISSELETIDLPYARQIFDILSRNLGPAGLRFSREGSGVKLVKDTLMNDKGYYQAPRN